MEYKTFSKWSEFFKEWSWAPPADDNTRLSDICEHAGALTIEQLLDSNTSEVSIYAVGSELILEFANDSATDIYMKCSLLTAITYGVSVCSRPSDIRKTLITLEKAIKKIKEITDLPAEKAEEICLKTETPYCKLINPLPRVSP